MKYLFVIQGDGRGHLTQAISLSRMLRENGHKVCGALLGKSKGREIPVFFKEKINAPVAVFETFSFVFDKENRNVDMFRTFFFNLNPSILGKYNKSLNFIHEQIEELQPDVVINFYEILVGFYHFKFKTKIPFISIAHQFITEHPDFKHNGASSQAYFILKAITQLTGKGSDKILALSLYPMRNAVDKNLYIVPPLLREEVLTQTSTESDFILGYMLNQGFEQEIRMWHEKNPEVRLKFFWDKKDAPSELVVDENFTLYKIDDKKFVEMMAKCKGYVTTAGFESVCEALFYDKPVMLIPAHVEQEVNAADAAHYAGCPVSNNFDISKLLEYTQLKEKSDGKFQAWVHSAEKLFLKYLTEIP
jgi:uncharacterized protein (TIGR00661 family)